MLGYFTFLVLFALTSSTLGIPGREEFKASFEKCAGENGIDPALFKGPPPMDATDDPKMKCFGACMMKQLGHMNEDGSVNTGKAIEHLPPDIPDRDRIVEAIKECSTKKGSDDCETAHEIWTCLRENNALPAPRGRGPPKN